MRLHSILVPILLVVAACTSGSDTQDTGAGQSNVTAAPAVTISGMAALGLRADLLDAIGSPMSGTLDFKPAVVNGAITVTHNYSTEKVSLAATSWDFGPRETNTPALVIPGLADNLDEQANRPAKTLYNAMTKARESTEHNPVLSSDVITRTSAKGLVTCTLATGYEDNGRHVPDQYECVILNVGSVGQSRSAF